MRERKSERVREGGGGGIYRLVEVKWFAGESRSLSVKTDTRATFVSPTHGVPSPVSVIGIPRVLRSREFVRCCVERNRRSSGPLSSRDQPRSSCVVLSFCFLENTKRFRAVKSFRFLAWGNDRCPNRSSWARSCITGEPADLLQADEFDELLRRPTGRGERYLVQQK